MKLCASLFSIAFAFSLASAESGKEFQTSTGLVRITLIPVAQAADSATAPDSLSPVPADTTAGSSQLPGGSGADALLEVYLLEKSTGEELRFPIKRAQMRDFMRGYPAGNGSKDERVVALVRELAVNLSVHMKTPEAGEEK